MSGCPKNCGSRTPQPKTSGFFSIQKKTAGDNFSEARRFPRGQRLKKLEVKVEAAKKETVFLGFESNVWQIITTGYGNRPRSP